MMQHETVSHAQADQMSGWRIFIIAFAGKIAATLFTAICVALGFGPDKWASYVIAGAPALVGPGIARLALLLLGSVTLYVTWWPSLRLAADSHSGLLRRLIRGAALIGICAPFVIGSFYVTASPHAQRHLNKHEKPLLIGNLKEISKDIPWIILTTSSGDEVSRYAIDWVDVLDGANIAYFPISGTGLDPKQCGVMVGLLDEDHPSTNAEKLINALKNSGFPPTIVLYRPHRGSNMGADFDLFIGPPCH